MRRPYGFQRNRRPRPNLWTSPPVFNRITLANTEDPGPTNLHLSFQEALKFVIDQDCPGWLRADTPDDTFYSVNCLEGGAYSVDTLIEFDGAINHPDGTIITVVGPLPPGTEGLPLQIGQQINATIL